MAAPERFAETSDSSCTAGAVHTWPGSVLRMRDSLVAIGAIADRGSGLATRMTQTGTWRLNCCGAIDVPCRFDVVVS